jgi:hypothetical protein
MFFKERVTDCVLPALAGRDTARSEANNKHNETSLFLHQTVKVID